ncbi:MAG TPA: hypothetical protein DDY78_21425 [Planctomycetales bacterium]|nr:hypothetical protein [Planctomycetales bacterium]
MDRQLNVRSTCLNIAALPRPPYSLGGRVRDMTLLWTALGAVVGVGSTSFKGGAIGVVSGAIAGILVLPFLGAFLGLIGGRPQETLFGALCGSLVGAAAGALGGSADLPAQATFTLLIGALIGATFPGMFRGLKETFLSILGSRIHSLIP